VNERQWIAELERADAAELAGILERAGDEQARVLRTYLGPETYERMRGLAAEAITRAAKKGNVVALHGIMGGELTYEQDGRPDHIWMKVFRLIAGQFDRFPLDSAGASRFPVNATGILKRFYGEQLLSLMRQGWNVQAFWYDWRLDVNRTADLLADKIRSLNGEPVHLVAHSMGGLVSRAFIRRHPDLWTAMWDSAGNGSAGGRLVMLGTPNHGSFSIPQLLFGLNNSVRKLALVDLRHSLQDLLEVVGTFIGSYQMLPSAIEMPDCDRLYRSDTYPHLHIEQGRLDLARQFHADLASAAGTLDPDRLVYIAGYDQPTYVAVRDWAKLSSFDGYEVSRLGDGTVPHRLGVLKGVPTYYARAEHGALPCDKSVMTALDEILEAGRTTSLRAELPETVRGEPDETARKELAARLELEEVGTLELVAPLKAALRSRGADAGGTMFVSETERQLEDLIVRDFVGSGGVPAPAARPASAAATAMGVAGSAGSVRIRLCLCDIERIGLRDTNADELAVDAISVGHYVGVRPVQAELALDREISGSLAGERRALVLTNFTERGILRGEIGQPFFLDDPRTRDDAGGETDRLIAIAGMGYPGRFGTPELTVLVRELVWSLSQLSKRHLATVLIGSGEGNIPVRDAVCAWLEGIRRALAQSDQPARRLHAITIVERSPGKLLAIQRAFELEVKRPALGLSVDLKTLPEPDLVTAAQAEAEERARRAVFSGEENWEAQANSLDASRFTVELEGSVYRYGAVTSIASVPERRITLDPDLVNEANDLLAAEADAIEQMKLGQYLLKLLIPADLRGQLATAHPLVVICDSTAARIHWEMVAQPDAAGLAGSSDATFLGIHRGLTRQLRTQFAPPPEPPPPPSRILRVLIVANPSATEPLPGAEAEGRLVNNLFERFRDQELQNPAELRRVAAVEIVPLIGPKEATRTRVMQELLLRPYDILHYAGHCVYDEAHPPASGWIFTGGKRLSANELSRIDQIPKFVFSNACQSGITPDRSGERAAGLAPSFAEAFFARGVQDFVCTGWPVGDAAALDFSEMFYSSVLGMDGRPPSPLHVALREARIRIFTQVRGRKTWGAYQHYGNPYTRLVASAPAGASDRAGRARAGR
jgi:pimeloyl-ACP methyl ester carboxylesterase